VTARRAKRENGGLGEDPPGSTKAKKARAKRARGAAGVSPRKRRLKRSKMDPRNMLDIFWLEALSPSYETKNDNHQTNAKKARAKQFRGLGYMPQQAPLSYRVVSVNILIIIDMGTYIISCSHRQRGISQCRHM